jgi:signal transduction histidine kinase
MAREMEDHLQMRALYIEKAQTLASLTAQLAHDMNTPTTAVLMNLHYLQDVVADGSASPEHLGDILEETRQEIVRLGRVIDQLFSYSITRLHHESKPSP